jgi:hypothetical protein
MIKNYENIIKAICSRFHHHITEIKVINWLDNFDRSDWTKALIVLNSFEYYTSKEVISEYDSHLKNIFAEIKNSNRVYALPVGGVGKSGLAMIYYLKKTEVFANKKISIIGIDRLEELNADDNLILVDDFSGSGGTIMDFYNSIRERLPKDHNCYILTVAYLNKAKVFLEKNNLRVFGNLRHPAFIKRGSVFGYYPKMKAIREFCFLYGNLLYPEINYNSERTKLHPLGYSNSQALIGFEHAIPNNTLSILWADRKRTDTGEEWYPIFPRRTQAYIKETQEFKKTTAYWISILYRLGLEGYFGFSQEEKYSNYNIRILSVIILKRRKKSIISICQFLGINLDDYDNIIIEGQQKGIFDASESLTENALRVIEQIRKKAKFEKDKYIRPDLLIDEDMIYLPKVFLGKS